MKMSEFLNMDMGEVSDWMNENGHDYVAIKNEEHGRLTEENARLRDALFNMVINFDYHNDRMDSAQCNSLDSAKQLLTELEKENERLC